jgi:hypothetical protein
MPKIPPEPPGGKLPSAKITRAPKLPPKQPSPPQLLSKAAHRVRAEILTALESLGAPREFLERLRELAPGVMGYSLILMLNPDRAFHVPDSFHPYEESPADWIARACAKYQRDLEEQMQEWQTMLVNLKRIDVDEPFAIPKRRRGPGKKHRTSSVADRCKWAAEWLLGRDWKDIACEYLKPGPAEVQAATDKVRNGANDILQTAGLNKSHRQPGKRK